MKIPTTKDISEDLKYLCDRTNIQIIDKSTDNFSFTCGRLDVLVATNHLQSEMYRKVTGRDGLKKDKGRGERGAEINKNHEDIGDELMDDNIVIGRGKNVT